MVKSPSSTWHPKVSNIFQRFKINYVLLINRYEFPIIADVGSSKVSEALREQLCLTDENLFKLCEIGIYFQNIYGSQRDIEWAIHKVRSHSKDSWHESRAQKRFQFR